LHRQEIAMSTPKDERREHQSEDTSANPQMTPDKAPMPQATTSPARPGKPGPRAPHAERGPGSAGADVGMSSDGGHAEDTTQARPDQTANERKR
jgi:hypothetical protein